MITDTASRKKILYDYIAPVSISENPEDDPSLGKKIDRMRREAVSNIFIITPKVADSYAYLRLVHALEKNGFSVRSLYVNVLTPDIFHYIDRAVDEIVERFSRGGCMVISYGSTHAGAILAAIFVKAGRDVETAADRVSAISRTLVVSLNERRFLELYAGYVRAPGARGASEKEVRRSGYIPDTDTELPAKISGAKEPSNAERQYFRQSLMEAPQPRPGESHAGKVIPALTEVKPGATATQAQARTFSPPPQVKRRFYTSLRFKLISIISAVIIISLSGMIFLATYYFKSDNRIRIQQGNLDIAKILALKVRSDFLTMIDNSKAITGEYVGRRGVNTGGSIASTDRSFLFYGVAKGSATDERITFISSAYNRELMEEIQTTKDGVDAIGAIHGKEFAKSFGGDIVVKNVSETLRFPVVGLSYPLRIKGRDAIDSIVVNYIRLDKVLLAFKAEDRVGHVFMINEGGDVIAHQDGEDVLKARNYINLPIVKEMLKSTRGNGQIRYRDENGTVFLGSFWKIGIGGTGVVSTVEEELALRQVYDMQRRNFYLMVIVLTLVIMIVFFFGTSITKPIIRLVDATKRIKEGLYRVDIAAKGKDEIAELTNAFVEMGVGLEEREKMKDAFGKFVNKEVAEQVLRGELRLGGERKDTAVLFSDIRSFTAISERLEPEEVVEFLNEYMTRMVRCINNTNGVVDKFIGDAIMAIWGAPVSHGNDIENAINAALMMRSELAIFNRDRGGPGKPLIQIGCGINAGPVLAGQIGSEDRMEYTVIGDTVNLASRIEALNKPFGTDILISQDAYNRVKDIFNVEAMQQIKVKGKAGPQQIYAVLGRKRDQSSPKNLEELRVLIGIAHNDISPGEVEEEVKYEIIEQ